MCTKGVQSNGKSKNEGISSMEKDRSRLRQPAPPPNQKLEDRYRKIGIPALAAAVGVKDKPKEPRQMSAEMPDWMRVDAES